MNILFICNLNKHRSKTAEDHFKGTLNVKSAGLYNSIPLSEEQLRWADLVLVMEERQRTEIGKRFPSLYLQKRIVCIDIPDTFTYRDPELIKILEEKLADLGLLNSTIA